jgi:hypothetical protein
MLHLRTMRDIRSRQFEVGALAVFATAGINAVSRLLSHASIGRMIMRTRISRTTAVALAAAVALTSFEIAPASAANLTGGTQVTQASTIDLSARRRHLRRGDALMLGAIAGVFGTIAAASAARRYRERYYYDEPYYYGYSAPYAYAPSYRFHHGHPGQHGVYGHRGYGSDFPR